MTNLVALLNQITVLRIFQIRSVRLNDPGHLVNLRGQAASSNEAGQLQVDVSRTHAKRGGHGLEGHRFVRVKELLVSQDDEFPDDEIAVLSLCVVVEGGGGKGNGDVSRNL